MTRRSVVVVGAGIGRQHLAAFKALPREYDVAALCDVDEARAQEVAEAHGISRIITDYAEVLRLDGLDIVDICTPPSLHFAMIRDALAADKDVICEKPLVGSLADVDALVELERTSGRKIMPIFQYRYGHGLQKLRHLVEHGVTGGAYLTTIETAWQRGAKYYSVEWRGRWQTELGGVCLTHAIHAHDMLTYVLGPVRSVFARLVTKVNPIEVEDCAAISVEMADGSLASLSATLGSAEEISRLRFCFENVTAESSLAPYTPSADPWTFKGTSEAAQRRIDEALRGFVPQAEGYEGQFARLAKALDGYGPYPVSLADARTSLELITAIYHSAETGAPVELPIDESHLKYKTWLPSVPPVERRHAWPK